MELAVNVILDYLVTFSTHCRGLTLGNSLGAFWHKQDSTLVAEQTAISSIFAFFVSIYSVFVERPG
jgi:hypothetical protein